MVTNILQYLTETAEKFPNKTAFCDGRDSVTFSSLLRLARKNAKELIKGTKKNDFIAVLTDRSIFPLIGFMSAVACGCCYVPIDASMPYDRMSNILSQINPAYIIYHGSLEKKAMELEEFAPIYPLICEDDGENEEYSVLRCRLESLIDLDPLYMIFTSGSTGTPKGILITHRCVIDFIEWFSSTCKLDQNDVMGNQAPFYFDLSVKDIYTAIRTGATVHILPQKFFMFPKHLAKYLNENKITTLVWVTSGFRLIASSGLFEKMKFDTVKKVILGGEALRAVHLNIWRSAMPDIEYINLYGPTEATVDCTYFPITREYADDEIIPIGKSCHNKEVMLLDDDLMPVLSGEIGEICVRGSGLAIGYFNDEEKTNKAFVQNPSVRYPDRIYRTGDLGRLDCDGNIIFVSRKDFQIKHMGYRIELGEIEATICSIDGVDDNVCIFDTENDRIICFCKSDLSEEELTAKSKTGIPKYMVPNVWIKTESFPQNANGKIDRNRLKEIYFDSCKQL